MSDELLVPSEALDMAKKQLFSRCISKIRQLGSWSTTMKVYHQLGGEKFLVAQFCFDKGGCFFSTMKVMGRAEAESDLENLFNQFPGAPFCLKKPQVAIEYDEGPLPYVARNITDHDWKIFQGWVMLRAELQRFGHPQDEWSKFQQRIHAKLVKMNEECMLHQRFMRIMNPVRTS